MYNCQNPNFFTFFSREAHLINNQVFTCMKLLHILLRSAQYRPCLCFYKSLKLLYSGVVCGFIMLACVGAIPTQSLTTLLKGLILHTSIVESFQLTMIDISKKGDFNKVTNYGNNNLKAHSPLGNFVKTTHLYKCIQDSR